MQETKKSLGEIRHDLIKYADNNLAESERWAAQGNTKLAETFRGESDVYRWASKNMGNGEDAWDVQRTCQRFFEKHEAEWDNVGPYRAAVIAATGLLAEYLAEML